MKRTTLGLLLGLLSAKSHSLPVELDKAAHYLAGYSIAATCHHFVERAEFCPLIVIAAGVAKEVWDSYGENGTTEAMDAWATALGGVSFEIVIKF